MKGDNGLGMAMLNFAKFLRSTSLVMMIVYGVLGLLVAIPSAVLAFSPLFFLFGPLALGGFGLFIFCVGAIRATLKLKIPGGEVSGGGAFRR